MKIEIPITWIPDANEADGFPPVKVAIIYDDIDAARRAMRVIDRVRTAIGRSASLRPRPWPIDFLEDSHLSTAAMVDATEANILIVALSNSSIAESAEKWIRQCLAEKRGNIGAVVALLGSEENADSSAFHRLQFLHVAAEKAGLDFFSPYLPQQKSVFGLSAELAVA